MYSWYAIYHLSRKMKIVIYFVSVESLLTVERFSFSPESVDVVEVEASAVNEEQEEMPMYDGTDLSAESLDCSELTVPSISTRT